MLLKDDPRLSRPQVVVHDRHAYLVRFPEEREAKASMECDRPGVDGRGQSLELRAPPRSSASFKLLIQPPTDPLALGVPPNRDQMDIAGWLHLRPKGEQVRDDPAVLPDDPCRVAELVHEHRMVYAARSLARASPEVLQVSEDVQEVLVRAQVQFHVGAELRVCA